MPKSVMPSRAKTGKVSQEKKRKNLAALAETPRLKRFFSARLVSSNVKTVALTRTPENVGENRDISFEAPFTLRLAGHIDILFFQCFCLQSLVTAYCSGECCFLPSHFLAQGSATYDPRPGSGLPSKIIRPAVPLQIVVIVWPA